MIMVWWYCVSWTSSPSSSSSPKAYSWPGSAWERRYIKCSEAHKIWACSFIGWMILCFLCSKPLFRIHTTLSMNIFFFIVVISFENSFLLLLSLLCHHHHHHSLCNIISSMQERRKSFFLLLFKLFCITLCACVCVLLDPLPSFLSSHFTNILCNTIKQTSALLY